MVHQTDTCIYCARLFQPPASNKQGVFISRMQLKFQIQFVHFRLFNHAKYVAAFFGKARKAHNSAE